MHFGCISENMIKWFTTSCFQIFFRKITCWFSFNLAKKFSCLWCYEILLGFTKQNAMIIRPEEHFIATVWSYFVTCILWLLFIISFLNFVSARLSITTFQYDRSNSHLQTNKASPKVKTYYNRHLLKYFLMKITFKIVPVIKHCSVNSAWRIFRFTKKKLW